MHASSILQLPPFESPVERSTSSKRCLGLCVLSCLVAWQRHITQSWLQMKHSPKKPCCPVQRRQTSPLLGTAKQRWALAGIALHPGGWTRFHPLLNLHVSLFWARFALSNPKKLQVIDPIYGPGFASLAINPAAELGRRFLLGVLGKPARSLLPHPRFPLLPSLSSPFSLSLTTTLTSSPFYPLSPPSKSTSRTCCFSRSPRFFFNRCSVSSSVRPFVSSPSAWRVYCKNDCCRVLSVTSPTRLSQPQLTDRPDHLFLNNTLLFGTWSNITTCAPLHLKPAYPVTFLYDIRCSHLRHRRLLPNNPTPDPIVSANTFFVPALDCIALHSSRRSNQPRDLTLA